MVRASLLLAALFAGAASGAAPAYSSDTIVNAANGAPGPFAPNSILNLFGTDLSLGTSSAALGSAAVLPTELSGVQVYVARRKSPLLYVSPKQINFLIPGDLAPGTAPVVVVRQGLAGPQVNLVLAPAAPQFFTSPDGYVIAEHGIDCSPITTEAPARPGEVILVYAAGLGDTLPHPNPGEIPAAPARMTNELKVVLSGSEVGADQILYAGVSPGMAGLYQVQLLLPDLPGGDLEIRATAAGQTSAAAAKLPTQPFTAGAR